jgi:predicted MFS family arabinose efflux permease
MKDISWKKARFAVLTAFFVNGAVMASWVSRIPFIQTKLGLNEAGLGVVLLGLSIGVLTALSLAGGLIARFGSPKVTIYGTLLMCISLPVLALIPNSIILWFALFIFGAALSTMDVAMNEQAVLVERLAGRPLMSSFHASFSIGGLAGALIGAGMASLSFMSPFIHFLIASLIFGGAMAFARPNLLPGIQQNGEKQSVFRLPERGLWLLGTVAFCSSIGEGSMADWSAVYLTRILNTDTGFAALGYAAFSLTMTVGRLIGDRLTAAIKPAVIVRTGGFVAALGLLATVLTQSPFVALIGFAMVGIGLANIVPLVFSAAGNFPGVSTGAGIAGVATIGYAGFLAGPPVIGLIAESTSLRFSFIFVLVLVGSLVYTANAISPKQQQPCHTEWSEYVEN